MTDYDFKQILKDHIEDLKNNNLDSIFKYLGVNGGVIFREFLEDRDIDPLKYITRLPDYYFYGELHDDLDLSSYINIKSIGEGAFKDAVIDTLILPQSIEEIGDESFIYTEIGTLTLSDNLKEIYSDTFAYIECNDIIYKGKKYNSDNIIEALEANGVEIIE